MLEGKLALVTGASRGIGEAIADELRRLGANVVGTSTSEEGAKRIQGRVLDVRNAEQCDALVKELGDIAILVNNAGITRDMLVMRMSDEDWDAVLDTNLKGAFAFTKALVRAFLRQRAGRIINLTSVAGLVGNAGQCNYAASKAGLIGLTKSAARELASRGITVNAIAPGFIETDMTAELKPEMKEALVKQIPLGALGQGEDVAHAALYLAAASGRYVTGQVLAVDGGMVM